MVQKTLLNFFTSGKPKRPAEDAPPPPSASPEKTKSKTKDKNDASSSRAEEDSPVKVPTSKRRKAQIIDSDSEDDQEQKETSSSSSPSKSEDEAKKENKPSNGVEKELISPKKNRNIKTNVGFTPDRVPPLRKTAPMKQRKRKSDGLEEEEQPKEPVKKLKMEDGSSATVEEEEDEDGNEPMEVDESPVRGKATASKQRSPTKKKGKSPYQKQKGVSNKNFFSKFQAPKPKIEPSEDSRAAMVEKPANSEDCLASDEAVKSGVVDNCDAALEPTNESNDQSKLSGDESNKVGDGSDCEAYNALTDQELSDSEDKPSKKNKKSSKSVSNTKEKASKSTEKKKKSKSPKVVKKEAPSPFKSEDGNSPKKVNSTTAESPSKNSSSGSPIKNNSSTDSSSKSPTKSSPDKISPTKDSPTKSSPTKSSPTKSSPTKSSPTKSSPSKERSHPGDRPARATINPFAAKTKTEKCVAGPSYNPAKSNYHPIDDAMWAQGEKVPYLALSRTFECIEETGGRLRTIEILSNLLRSVIAVTPDDLLYTIYLCLNKVAPAFAGLELNVGESLLMKVVAQTTGRSMERIKADAKEMGDLGKVAEASKSSQRVMFQPAKLNVRGVFEKLKEIANMSGHSVQTKKVDKIKAMFVACRESEARFLIRSLGGKLRIGLAEQSVLQAIGQACYLTPPGQELPPAVLNAGKGQHPDTVKAKVEEFAHIVKTTYCECPSYDSIVPVLLSTGVLSLPEHCKLQPGVPLKPMLAHPTKGVSEVFKRFEDNKFTCEYKYDGERAQIHLSPDGTVNVYSRNQEDNTTKYPDIIRRLQGALGSEVKSCVLDTEAVAWDREKKQILPFQVLSTRKRKDVQESDIKVQVCVFPFDLLYLNGESLVRKPFEERRSLLRQHFNEVEGEFTFATSMDSTNTEDIQDFLEESIKGNCEGLMVKTLDVDATYEIAKRSHNWLKLKKDYLDGVGDSLDVVVIGGFMGRGKRAGQYGGFLLACYDPNNEEFQSICKIGTGFTDESLTKHTEFFKDHCIDQPKSYYRYDSAVEPDQWFDAVQVWEIKCADLSVSPVHKAAAGIVDPEKGISLRFPRFLRIRDDKTAEQATSAQQIADMYNNQDQIKNATQDKMDAEDFY